MDALACARCGTDNRPGRRFCRGCGSPLAAACPTCGAALEPGDRFCGECGAEVGAAMPVAAAGVRAPGQGAAGASLAVGRAGAAGDGDGTAGEPGPATERRLVSVLFADLVGFTALAEGRDPESVRDLLGRYYETAAEIVGRYGGLIEKFIGDAVMAVWGTPAAREDDAERAVRAALDLVAAVPHLAAAGEGTAAAPALAARAGVLTGEAVVTLGATGQGMVAGDLVNTASRLQSVAPAGTVLAGEATVNAAESAIVFEPAGAHLLKGKETPVPAWRALRVVAGRRGAGRAARVEAPFVGREDELRLIKELFHATARERRLRLVSVTGIAGIGKSRLAWEFEKYVDGLVETVYWHRGRSPAYGDGLAFWALGEMIRERAGIAESDDGATARTKLHETLVRHLPDEAERDWVERRLGVLIGLDAVPSGGPEELFAAWRTLFERIAEEGITVLVFEELHWADSSLLDFIGELAARSRQRPIFVLTLARPDLLERRSTWGAGLRNFTALDLGPLDDAAMDALLVGLVPGLPPAAVRAIRERAEGVPLYAVETVRMLLDQGRLVEADGTYTVEGDLRDLAVPDSLTGLIGARVDALAEDERAVLGHAAVLGMSFTLAALAAATGRTPADLQPTLDGLEEKEILAADRDPRSPERGQYRFVQALLREVAYGRLSRRERLARHLAAAAWFEQQEDDEIAGVVAAHYVDAYRAAGDGPEAAALADRARRALVAAAGRASTLQAQTRAIGYFDEAAALAPDERTRLDLMERAADAAQEGLDSEAALEYATRVLEAAQREVPRDPARVARAWARVGRVHVYAGRPDEGLRALEQGLAEVGDAPDSLATIRLAAETGRANLMAGRFAAAATIIEGLLPRAERLADRQTLAELFTSYAWALNTAERHAQATAMAREAYELAQHGAPPQTRFRTVMNLTYAIQRDDPSESARIALEEYAIARRLGYAQWAQSLAGNAAEGLLWTGEWDGLDRLAREVGDDETSGVFRFGTDVVRAQIAAVRGRSALASELLATVAAGGAFSDPQVTFSYRSAEAWVAFANGDDERALQILADLAGQSLWTVVDAAMDAMLLRAAVAVGDRGSVAAIAPALPATAQVGRSSRANLLSAHALWAALDGREADARAGLDEAIAVLRTIDTPFALALALTDRVLALPDDADRPRVEAEAREILGRLGAVALLDRLDRAAGGAGTLAPAAGMTGIATRT